jgi:Carboxypeptidase regulatory-like domain
MSLKVRKRLAFSPSSEVLLRYYKVQYFGKSARPMVCIAGVLFLAFSIFPTVAQAQSVKGNVVDQDGVPQARVVIRFDPGAKSATTDAEGFFNVDDLKDGAYTAVVQIGGSSQSFPVRVGGGRLDPEIIRIKAQAREQSVRGKVEDGDGRGVPKATVSLAGPKRGTVVTNAEGFFFFSGPAGDYEVSVGVGEKSKKYPATIDRNRLRPETFTID